MRRTEKRGDKHEELDASFAQAMVNQASELPNGWQRLTVGEVVTNSRTLRTTEDNPIPFIPMALLPQGGAVTSRWEMRTQKEIRSGVPFVEGDVLFAKITPCLENGKVGLARGIPDGGGMTSTEVYPLRPSKVTAEFLAAFLSQPIVRHTLASKMQGTTGRQRLPKEVLDSFPIPVPPLPEQREIASALRTVQLAKEACERVIAATRQLKQSLLQHLFTYGAIPFDQADKVPLKETDAGPIPENWQITNLEMLKAAPKGAIVSGPFGSNIGKRFFVPSGVPLIRGCNLTTGEALFVEEGFVFITEEKAQELANCTALPGDLIFTAAGTIGQVGLIPERRRFPKYVISNKQLRARVDKSKADFLFLFYWFTQPRMQALIKERKSGTSIPVINLSVLRTLPIGLPSLPEQREIAAQLSAVDARLAAEEARRIALDNLFKSLLHNLMIGKVRVNPLTVEESAGAVG